MQPQNIQVLHPDQFQVNEAWIVFKLNDAPIHTGADGDFDFIALMDAASCYILGSSPVPANADELTRMDAKRMLKQGQAEAKQWPKTLFVPAHEASQQLKLEAEQQGMAVVQVPEDQLMIFIGGAKQGFRERFGG